MIRFGPWKFHGFGEPRNSKLNIGLQKASLYLLRTWAPKNMHNIEPRSPQHLCVFCKQIKCILLVVNSGNSKACYLTASFPHPT